MLARLQISRPFPVLALRFSLAAAACLVLNNVAQAQLDLGKEPIRYLERKPRDAVARLQEEINVGRIKLAYDDEHGYLPALLAALQVPQSSQTLVFSKTSLQLMRISPKRPRALYFNDETYLGWVQRGEVMEISSVDPELGTVFYTLSQEPTDRPVFLRDQGNCLTCHASSRTEGVPGSMIRSVYANGTGQPQFGAGTFNTTDATPFEKRWGGWYVTGTHGAMRHMGNVISKHRDTPEEIDRDAGANVTDLSPLFDVSPYLEPTSDIVALMVLEHQAQMHNLMALAHFETLAALHYDKIMNDALDRPAGHMSDSARRRIAAVGDRLLECLLFSGEFPLSSQVQGASKFAAEFESRGPKDAQGRSLRDLDLRTRLFKYPCSYLICSPQFDALPAAVKSHVIGRLRDILAGKDESAPFAHLSAEDRRNIAAILREVKPEALGER
jgi:hypothetical protein